jgi:hypothetical protein
VEGTFLQDAFVWKLDEFVSAWHQKKLLEPEQKRMQHFECVCCGVLLERTSS